MTDSPDFAQELGKILDTAIAVQHADFGNVQVFDEKCSTLRNDVQRGGSLVEDLYVAEIGVLDGDGCVQNLAQFLGEGRAVSH